MREYSFGIDTGLESSLSPSQLGRVAQAGTAHTYARHEPVYRQGEQADDVFVLVRGRVKSTLVAGNGQEAILRIHLPHSLLGLSALASRPCRDASAIALERVEAARLPRPVFVEQMRRIPELNAHVIQLLVDRMSDFHHRVGELLTQSVECRVARILFTLSTPDTGAPLCSTAQVALSHDEIAQLALSRRPTVSGIIGRFARMGLVSRGVRRLEVLDRQGLAAIAAGNEQAGGVSSR